MPFQELRRSERLGTYDANGRDYLSSKLGWTRPKFEEWLYSSSVCPHLQEWYTACIADKSRYNDGIDWINTGEKGYFYNESDLEEDVLLMCLDVGNGEHDVKSEECSGIADFSSAEIDTESWITQQMWARTAWRLVHSNCAAGQAFHSMMSTQPAAAYGFAIEMLCIVFHSVAFRGVGSVYLPLLKSAGHGKQAKKNREVAGAGEASQEPFDDDAAEEYTASSSSSAADHTSDATFTNTRRERAASELSTIILLNTGKAAAEVEDDCGSNIVVSPQKHSAIAASSPKATVDKSSNAGTKQYPLTPDSITNSKRAAVFEDDEFSTSKRVREWIEKTG